MLFAHIDIHGRLAIQFIARPDFAREGVNTTLKKLASGKSLHGRRLMSPTRASLCHIEQNAHRPPYIVVTAGADYQLRSLAHSMNRTHRS